MKPITICSSKSIHYDTGKILAVCTIITYGLNISGYDSAAEQ